MGARQPTTLLDVRVRIEAFQLQAEPVESAWMEITDLDSIHGRVGEGRIVNSGSQSAAAAFHVSRRAPECRPAECGNIRFTMMVMVIPITLGAGQAFFFTTALLFGDDLIGARCLCCHRGGLRWSLRCLRSRAGPGCALLDRPPPSR